MEIIGVNEQFNKLKIQIYDIFCYNTSHNEISMRETVERKVWERFCYNYEFLSHNFNFVIIMKLGMFNVGAKALAWS